MCTMLQEIEAFGTPTFYGGVNNTDKGREKLRSKGHLPTTIIVGLIIAVAVISSLGAVVYYYYKVCWQKGTIRNFR